MALHAYRSIQALRGVAVLMVALVHLFPDAIAIGTSGVDIFFVISGFIMATIGVRQRPGDFIIRRIARIVPLYWAVTLFMCALALKPGLFANFSFDTARLLQSLFFIPYRETSGIIWPLVKVGWTLNFEVFFYAVFTLCLFTQKPVPAALGLLCALILAGRLLNPQHAILVTWTSPLLAEFLFGLLIALSLRPFETAWQKQRAGGLNLSQGRRWIGWASLGPALAVGGVVWLGLAAAFHLTPDNNGWRFVVFGGGAALLVWGCLLIETAGAWSAVLWPLERVGDASYGFYLLHGLVIALVVKVLGHGILAAAVVLAVSILVSFLSLSLFERPVGRLLRVTAPRH